MFVYNGKKLTESDDFVDSNGTKHPPSAWKTRYLELGIVQVADQIYLEPREHYDVVENVDGTLTQTLKSQGEIIVIENDKIKSQIAALEKSSIDLGFFRFLREYCIADVIERSAAQNITLAQLLDKNGPNYAPGFAKVYAHNEELSQLRQGIKK